MHSTFLRLITGAWTLIALFWLISALRSKAVALREPALSRLLHIALLAAACFLLTDARIGIGFLARRFSGDEQWTDLAGVLLTITGCGFAIWARACLGSNWSATVTVKQDHELIRSGPYALVRHPIYSGLLLATAGTALVVGEVRAAIAFAIVFAALLVKAGREERFMTQQFGGEYLRYSSEVKRLVPFVL
jgi:protein-S-isoprenylcysteine O-methyltransferase Ste14